MTHSVHTIRAESLHGVEADAINVHFSPPSPLSFLLTSATFLVVPWAGEQSVNKTDTVPAFMSSENTWPLASHLW